MIRAFNNADLPHCVGLLIETYNIPPWNDKWSEESAKEYLTEFIMNSGFKGFVIEDDSAIIGAAFCHTRKWWNGSELYVDEFYINPRYQRKGHGKALMQVLENYVFQYSLKGISLATSRKVPAYSFYEHCGFKLLQSIVFMYHGK